ncbi:dCTP deaminase [Clostridium perfringens]|uniref:dCTP deaminase n=1 Tax=Clostridium perfringens TaxID=1502 RepID=UPI001A26D933|nr:dCTP deaminase [Clostridium perfringens]ELC8360719.1 dCTP deaminase [Clostridium perfringens]MCX0379719.1 dCTP deaminase [Clostridium perfringens]HAT4244901.1 dCTP deaminase [Clostridium perfringens]
MQLINNKNIQELFAKNELVITPILSRDQIGQASIDLRLGNIFKVSRQTREGFIDISKDNIEKFFDTSYRDFGEDFILYPNQLVLANTFEFIKLPNNIMSNIYTRSSINRLGVKISSIAQPGYSGTLTLELINRSDSPVKLKCGMRIIQLVLFDVGNEGVLPYRNIKGAKYIANTEPKVSNIFEDLDLDNLNKMISL